MRARILACGVALIAACEPSSSVFGPGLGQKLRVDGAQLLRGGLGPDEGGPAVSQVLRPQPEVTRGDGTVMLRGRLAPGGVALHLQAEGDPDRWLIRARGFDFAVPDELQWSATLGFSYALQADAVEVRLQAADANGRLGPISATRFAISDAVPAAELVVSLAWDAAVDLDLHVRDPNGVVIGAKNINAYDPPPGQVPSPDDWMQGGWLDFDSNQECRLDLRNRENIVWLAPPPPGRYQVYAQLYAACGRPAVTALAAIHLAGTLLTQADARLYDFDAREHPGEGDAPGLLLTEFEVPASR